MDGLFTALQSSELATYLRESVWAYPLVNTLHITGIALLFGAIAGLDLRLLGLWRTVPVAPLARVLVPVAAAGLLLAATAGALLFLVRADQYANATLFQAKLLLIAAAVTNAALLRTSGAWRNVREVAGGDEASGGARQTTPLRLKWAGALSLLLWLAAIAAGRLLGYL